MKIMDLIDRAEDEIVKLSSLGELLALVRYEGLAVEANTDGVYLIMRDGLWRLRDILSTLHSEARSQTP